MSDYDRKAMIDEANELGLEFKGNISNKALAALLAEEKGEPIPLDEPAPPSPAMKKEKSDQTDVEDDIVEGAAKIARRRAQEKIAKRRAHVAARREKAMATEIVTITNRDSREATKATTAYLSVQNQYFAVAKAVPLDMPVELEHCLIRAAETCMMTQHVDEVVGGKSTGNKIPTRVPKYTISYGRGRG